MSWSRSARASAIPRRRVRAGAASIARTDPRRHRRSSDRQELLADAHSGRIGRRLPRRFLAERPDFKPVKRSSAIGVERHALASSKKPDRIASHDAIRELQALLPRDTIYTVDSGEHVVIGGGLLGLEAANALEHLGLDTTSWSWRRA